MAGGLDYVRMAISSHEEEAPRNSMKAETFQVKGATT